MELRQLEYFIQICNSGSFTKASEVLNVSQPTLSQQIRVLEGEFNIPLFNRIGRGIKITDAGKILFDKGISIMHLLDEVNNEFIELKGLKRGFITVGGLLEDLNYLTPQITQFHHLYPNIFVKIIESEDVVNQIIENNIDIGITRSSQVPETLTITFLYCQEFVLVVEKNHSLDKKPFVTFRELVGLSRIMVSSSCREVIDLYFKNLGCSLCEESLVTESSFSLLSLVRNGFGVAIVPISIVDFVREDSLSVVRIVDPIPSQDINLIHRDDKILSYAASVFINRLKDSEKH
ncbi:LysR family transcriptional regulator [Neobacillus sp. KR4-4]|uniref:LysR family transcriptional regulator n=1 Tax=Neobacillus sp. KR4-4 TaxID=3344872 RepID=UPI0035CBACC8